jgi:hypothetical protein
MAKFKATETRSVRLNDEGTLVRTIVAGTEYNDFTREQVAAMVEAKLGEAVDAKAADEPKAKK